MHKIFCNIILCLVALYLSVNQNINAQQFYRIKAEYTIKYISSSNIKILQKGTTFYDINNRTLVIKNKFPKPELIVKQDSIMYKIHNQKVVEKYKTNIHTNLSIFHLVLTGNLENFGLDKAGYKIEEIKEDKGLVISIWTPADELNKYFGKVLIATKNRQLYSVVFLNTEQEVIAKHFFSNYINVRGLYFPAEVLRISFDGNNKSYRRSTYKNIILNDSNDEGYYNINKMLNN